MINKIKRGFKKLNWILNDLLFWLKIKQLSNTSKGRRIIIYHGITKNARTDINARFISTDLFEKQIEYFKENFNVVTLTDYLTGASHPSKLTITLTFDDGYLNNLTEALPILEKHQVPATFYITTIRKENYNILWADLLDLYRITGPDSFTFKDIIYHKKKNEYYGINGSLKQHLKESGWDVKKELLKLILSNNNFERKSNYFPYFKLMDEDQIRELSKSKYAEVGSHGLYHNCLDKVTLDEAKIELLESKDYLERITQQTVTSVAYPDGSYTREVLDIAEELGYQNQLAVDYWFKKDISDSRIEKRFGINPYISFNNQIQSIINGKY